MISQPIQIINHNPRGKHLTDSDSQNLRRLNNLMGFQQQVWRIKIKDHCWIHHYERRTMVTTMTVPLPNMIGQRRFSASRLNPHDRIWHSTARSNCGKLRSSTLMAGYGHMMRQIDVSLHRSHFRLSAHGEEER
ncbi:PREDICTED: uncharacterized protein LOC108662279 [Theobroma cacao]|uniref:Uncharacterized protein LOC108662279 n=1 Tax=Theobroma cacao TaxID=3641 RepID=A0AB32WBC9_THECC|nr:PREDICTED: uncharacterized protein LOC108662279 [Theobroma cacao]